MKTCLRCGTEFDDDALFCTKCGTPVSEGSAAAEGVAAAETSDAGARAVSAQREKGAAAPECAGAPRGKKGVAAVRTFIEEIFLRIVAIVVCAGVFIGGFFINISFMPMEQVQSKITVDSAGDVSLEGMLMTSPFEQNVFNVIGALTVSFDLTENQEKSERITETMTARVTEVMLRYEERITELTAQVSQGNERALTELISLYRRAVRDITTSMADINLIEMDRLEAEIAYSESENSQIALKGANDALIRTAIMSGYMIGAVYLQVVALVYLIVAVIGLLAKKNVSVGKFFFLYMLGICFLFGIGQLTATSLGGAGMFCFIFAVVLCAIWLAGKLFCGFRVSGQGILSLSIHTVATVLSFAAVCLLFGNIFEFGGIADKIGSVFGLHVYESGAADATYTVDSTLINFCAIAAIYLAVYVPAIIVFFRSAARLSKSEEVKTSDKVLSAVAAGVALVGYLALYICSQMNALELLVAPSAFYGIFVLFAIVFIAFMVSGVAKKSFQRKDPANGGKVPSER